MTTPSGSTMQIPLERGERQLWIGMPKQGIVFRGQDIVLIPFSLLWGGFALFWEISVIASGAPFFFWLWGLPFCAIGLFMIAGRFFVDARRRARTIYAITTDRAVIISGLRGYTTRSFDLRSMQEVTLTEAGDGSGTVAFGQRQLASRRSRSSFPGVVAPEGFELVPDARRVYETLREAQRAARETSEPRPA